MEVSNSPVTICQTLDATDVLCPLPLLKLKLQLKSMAVGEAIELLASDATSKQDIPAFCQLSGQELVSFEQRQGIFVFTVKKTR